MSKKNEPIEKFRFGSIEVAVWENQQKNGKSRSISIQKSYRDKNNDWQTTNSFFENEIEILISLINKAQKFLG